MQELLRTGIYFCKLEVNLPIHLDVIKKRKEKHNPDGTGGCVKKYLWNSKNFDIIGAGTPEPGERQEDKCT